MLEDLLDLAWQLMESSNDLVSSFGERDAVFGQLEGHHQESNVLRGVGLRVKDQIRRLIFISHSQVNVPWWTQHQLQVQH